MSGPLRRYVYPAAAGVFWLLAALRLAWLYRMTGGVVGWDYRIYTAAVERAVQGIDPYQLGEIGTGFINHPGLLLIVYPFMRLGTFGSAIWAIGLLAAWPLTLWCVSGQVRMRPVFVLLLPLTAAVEGLFMGQASIPAGLCLAAAWVMLKKGRDYPAGLLIGLGMLFKLSLGIFGLYFLLKRRWRAFAALGAVFAAFSLASERLLFPGINGLFLKTMARLTAEFHTGAQNASLAGLPYARVIGILLLIGLSWAVVREGNRTESPLIFGGLAAWTLLVSPLTWHHHFVFLALPLAVLLARRPWLGLALAGAVQVDLLGQAAGLPIHTAILAAAAVLLLNFTLPGFDS